MGLFDLFKGGKGASGRKTRILIVDDEPNIGEALQSFLESKGFETAIAPDGRKGVDAAKELIPDLIIMDLTMPGMNGLEACTMLKQNPKTQCIPILLLTALPMELANLERAFKSGTDAYMTKPYDNDQILEKVNKLMSGSDAAQQLKKTKH